MGGSGGPASFLLRQVITTGYILAGYRNSSPWTSVNRTAHSTDTTVDLGGQLNNSTAYPGGMCDDTFAYVLKANNTVGGNSSQTNRYSMRTETSQIGPSAPYNVGNAGTIMHQEQTRAYGAPADGNNAIMRFQFSTQTWLSSIGKACGNSGQTMSAIYHETKGFHYGDDNGVKLTFATEAQACSPCNGVHGQQKGISSKLNYLYAGNEGNYSGGYNLRRFSVATESNVGNVSKPIGNSGEENFDMGQAHQYMVGMYNGEQNNRAWRFNYATDSGYEGGGSMQSKGVPGRSSAYSAYRS